jgi:hypothetical protein
MRPRWPAEASLARGRIGRDFAAANHPD